MMPLLCLFHPLWEEKGSRDAYPCSCQVMEGDGCFQDWDWVKKQSNLFCGNFPSDLISADAELL